MTLNNQFISDSPSQCNCDSCVESRKQFSNYAWIRDYASLTPGQKVLVYSDARPPTEGTLRAVLQACAYGYDVNSGDLVCVPLCYTPDYWFDGSRWNIAIKTGNKCDVCGLATYHYVYYGKYSVHMSCMNYSSANTTRLGNVVKLPEFSLEFEMSRQYHGCEYDESIIELLQKKFARTQDGTVSDEMLSPIYRSDRDFLDVLPVLNKAGRFVDGLCGTHIHVGITQYPKLWYQDRGMDIVSRLGSYIDDSPHTPKIWGRGCGRWCEPTYGGDRYMWLNMYSNWNTIEFRLPRFNDSEQYKNIVRYCRYLSHDLRKVYNQHLRRSCTDDKWSNSEATEHFLSEYARFEKAAMKGKQYHV